MLSVHTKIDMSISNNITFTARTLQFVLQVGMDFK